MLIAVIGGMLSAHIAAAHGLAGAGHMSKGADCMARHDCPPGHQPVAYGAASAGGGGIGTPVTPCGATIACIGGPTLGLLIDELMPRFGAAVHCFAASKARRLQNRTLCPDLRPPKIALVLRA